MMNDEESISSSDEGLCHLLGMDVASFRLLSDAADDDKEEGRALIATSNIPSRNATDVMMTIHRMIPVDNPRFLDENAFIVSPVDGTIARPISSKVVQLVNHVDVTNMTPPNTVANQGLVAVTPIRKGQVVFTERAMIATQIPVACSICTPISISSSRGQLYRIKACQYCFRSLEPASSIANTSGDTLPLAHLWPIAEYRLEELSHDSNSSYASPANIPDRKLHSNSFQLVTDIYPCPCCQALFCSYTCARQARRQMFSCCSITRSIQAVLHQLYCLGQNESNCMTMVEPTLVLATKMFCHATQQYRVHYNNRVHSIDEIQSPNGGALDPWQDPYLHFCGEAHDIHAFPSLDSWVSTPTSGLSSGTSSRSTSSTSSDTTIIDYINPSTNVLHETYVSLCSALDITPEEGNFPLTVNLFHRYISVAQRNGFNLATQSPFTPYYHSLVRMSNKDVGGMVPTHRHQDIMQQLAFCLGSKDGKLDRTMDSIMDEKV